MGLRAKIVVVMVLVLTLLAAISTAFVRLRVNAAIQLEEENDAKRDMRLLLTVLNTQLLQIDGVLRSWSYWTALYDHAQRPSVAFRDEELSVQAVGVAQVDWLGLIEADGRLTEQVLVPPGSGSELLAAPKLAGTLQQQARYIAALSATTPHSCGIAQLEDYLSFICFRPLLDSQGQGPAHGTVVLGRRITARMLAEVAEQSRMQFRIVTRPSADKAAPRPDGIDTPFGRGAPTLSQAGDQHLLLTFPLLDINQRHLADMQLTWPRLAMAGAQAELEQTTWLLLLLIAGTGVAAIVVVDVLVVRRLERLKDELGAVVATGRWDGDVRARGRDEIATLATFCNSLIGVVRRQMVDLEHMAMTDTLTGLANRRSFDKRLGRVVQLGEDGAQRSCSLVLIDVDCFKRYNDIHGHPAGDEALKVVAHCLQALARNPGDLPARVGGEEFALLLEDTTFEEAFARAEATCQSVVDAALPHQGNTAAPVMTLSCGVATLRPGDTASTFYVRADQGLYAAKQSGRNRVAPVRDGPAHT